MTALIVASVIVSGVSIQCFSEPYVKFSTGRLADFRTRIDVIFTQGIGIGLEFDIKCISLVGMQCTLI